MDDFALLEKKYLSPTSLNDKFDRWLDHVRTVSNEEKIFFTQNLGVMLKSGLAASRALRTLTLQSNNAKFKRILWQVSRQVEKGIPIAEAMRPYPQVFPVIFVNMIKAGEAAGQLEEVLTELTRQMKKSHELRAKVKGALMYPAAIVIAMVGIGGGMMIFVIPKLISIFTEMRVQLPLPTRLLIGFSNTINNNLFIFGLLFIGLIVGFLYWRARPTGKKFFSLLALKLPIIKPIAIKINLAQIARTLSSLLTTDMPIVESLKLASAVTANTFYRDSLLALAANVEKGKTISSEMLAWPKLYPPVVQQMTAVGEETGEIAKILSQLAAFYEEDVSQTMDSLPSIIEPVLIVLLGGAVGGMAVAIILPMFTLTQSV